MRIERKNCKQPVKKIESSVHRLTNGA